MEHKAANVSIRTNENDVIYHAKTMSNGSKVVFSDGSSEAMLEIIDLALIGARDLLDMREHMQPDVVAFYMEMERVLSAAQQHWSEMLQDDQTLIRLPMPSDMLRSSRQWVDPSGE